MRLMEIREESGLWGLKPAWEALLRDTPSNTIFNSWEWATSWWSVHGQPGALRILAALDDDGTCRGIAPFFFEPARRFGCTVPALRFLGDGSNDSDYLDILVSRSQESEVIATFRNHLLGELHRGTVLRLHEVQGTSPHLSWLRELVSAGNIIRSETDVPCGSVRLPESWDDYLTLLRPRFRTKVRSALRNVASHPDVELGFCKTHEEVGSLLPVLFELHTKRWNDVGKPGVFGGERKRAFYAALSAILLERGWLRFSWLKWRGEVLACQYGFEYSGIYSQLQEGYEPDAEHWNPGIALRAWSIQEFINAGVREYDFLAGIGRHKSDWGAEVKHSTQLLIAGDTWKNRLFSYGPGWEEHVKELAARIIPERFMAARRARIERKLQAALLASQNGLTARPRQWGGLRAVAANSYYYSPLPGVAQILRNRYRLSVASPGNRPSWSSRADACARILYYHRVNDDNDPFFHAISSDFFDQQMRYIARYYKVVSLSDMLKHLESGSREMVVALTFDDGYQDNYQNAFRILQRYNLPATVFLTTDPVDSGERLWFERLALALKTTAREFIDLEIDLPRRLLLRTEAERLDANNRIFAILRTLPDRDRRVRLDEILMQLAPPDEKVRENKMLTWDQIRLMKTHGIDFGGHTKTHPFISKLTQDEVVAEVSGCKRRIEEELQLPVEFFAYPNGREEDFGMWNKEVVRAAGYRAALTTIWGMNYRGTDPMELRRGGPWETSLPLFAYKMDWYQLTHE
jgi:peptidoglycan/xylan/chitin deacetylase (PgdA/CDA1 family)/CelD/BcsL family acetyltransferase involved in cellulose biosynthesis